MLLPDSWPMKACVKYEGFITYDWEGLPYFFFPRLALFSSIRCVPVYHTVLHYMWEKILPLPTESTSTSILYTTLALI